MIETNKSTEELLNRIKELEAINQELLNEKEQEAKLEYALSGNLGHWYWNIKTNEVTFNPLKVTTLGYDKSEIPELVTYQFFTDKIHPHDYQDTMDAMQAHINGKSEVYEVEYRIQKKDGKYKWYYDRGKITQYDEDGKPLLLAGIVFDITEKKEIHLELEYKNVILAEMSSIDGLTKISNRRALIEYLRNSISEANQTNNPLSIAMFDIDDFKIINDSKGDLYGDNILFEIATKIKANIRDTDLAGRYGGEEFTVIFTNTDLAKASKIAERIREDIANTIFKDDVVVTISGGVKEFKGETLRDFVDGADKNLYEAKNNGKNQVISK